MVRVKVKLRTFKGGFAEVVALANAGYESDVPEVALPISIAKLLTLYPAPRGSIREQYVSAAGKFTVIRIPRSLEVTAITGDREVGPITSDAIIAKGVNEALLNDQLISELRMVLVDPGKGLWRFRDDPAELLRRSEPRETR